MPIRIAQNEHNDTPRTPIENCGKTSAHRGIYLLYGWPISDYSPVPGIQTRLQNGVGGISHYIFVNGYLDMKNHRGDFPPSC